MSKTHIIQGVLFLCAVTINAFPAAAYDNAYCSIKQISTDPLRTARTETSGAKFTVYCEDKNMGDVIVQTVSRTCMYNAVGKNNMPIIPNYSCSNIGGRSLKVSEWDNLHTRYSIICSECLSPGKWTPGTLVGQ